MNCNHIFHKSCTITITNIAQSKSTQETSLAITIKKQVLLNQETSFCNHNPETIVSTTLPQSCQPPAPLPHVRRRGRAPRTAPGGLAPRAGEAAPRREAARPRHAPGSRHALDLRDGPCSTYVTAGGGAGALPQKLLPGEEREKLSEIEIG